MTTIEVFDRGEVPAGGTGPHHANEDSLTTFLYDPTIWR